MNGLKSIEQLKIEYATKRKDFQEELTRMLKEIKGREAEEKVNKKCSVYVAVPDFNPSSISEVYPSSPWTIQGIADAAGMQYGETGQRLIRLWEERKPTTSQIQDAEAELLKWEHEWMLNRERANIAIKGEQEAGAQIRKWRDRLEQLRGKQ